MSTRFERTLLTLEPSLASRVAAILSLRAQHEASARSFLVAPRDLPLSRPSPRGKMNSRGAGALRQIESSNSLLTQVRRRVTDRARRVTSRCAASGALGDHGKTRSANPELRPEMASRTFRANQDMVMKP